MSAAPKFTPGPWEVDATRILANDERRTVVCEVTGSIKYSSTQADARLIAAAPDLYAAAVAAIAYDAAIHSCANDPDKMTEFGTAQGDDLDLLYADWIDKAGAGLAKVSA